MFTVNRRAKENKKGPQAVFDDLRSTERFSKKGIAYVIQNYQMSMQDPSPGSALLRALVSPPAGRMCHAYRRLGRDLSLLRTAEPGCLIEWGCYLSATIFWPLLT